LLPSSTPQERERCRKESVDKGNKQPFIGRSSGGWGPLQDCKSVDSEGAAFHRARCVRPHSAQKSRARNRVNMRTMSSDIGHGPLQRSVRPRPLCSPRGHSGRPPRLKRCDLRCLHQVATSNVAKRCAVARSAGSIEAAETHQKIEERRMLRSFHGASKRKPSDVAVVIISLGRRVLS